MAIETETLHLRGVDGSVLDLPLSQLVGVALILNTIALLAPTVDLLLGSGEAIEIRSPATEAITESLSGAGIRVVSA